MKNQQQAITMTQLHSSYDEREQLLQECHALVVLIGQKRYSVRLLRAARDGLLLYLNYKECRQRRQHSREGKERALPGGDQQCHDGQMKQDLSNQS